jgi:hypothetical protein
LARISADCAARIPVIARALPSSLFSALRVDVSAPSGHPRIRRPAGARVVEQSLSEVFPNRLGAGEPDGVGLLDLDSPPKPAAADPEHVLLDLVDRSSHDRT